LFYERITGKVLVDSISPSWLIFSEGFKKSRIKKTTKRITGIMISMAGLLLTAPLLIITAISIRLDSPGSVFFRQERVGENDKIFYVLKFRSMIQDAECEGGPVWAEKDDPRVTRVGKIIRKLRIDEIPQMINVLKGEMSFVGPRPERPEFVEELKKEIPYYSQRHSVKPGITGWAQIMYQYGSSVEDAREKLQYDLYYVKNMSTLLDLMIIFKTVKVVLLRKGAR
jgi:Sugar transferases involved in lipopolysaccharide synthesis